MKVNAFITPHRSERMAECQDCFAINPGTAAAAVSDGVSQSIFPLEWARLLAGFFVRSGPPSDAERRALCHAWRESVQDWIVEEKALGHNPWRAESNLAEGLSAGATLCGVVFWDEQTWTCDVLGDSCLLVVGRDGAVGIVSSEQKAFDTSPDYLDSHPLQPGRGRFRHVEGTLKEGECLILVSDPFSEFLSRRGDKAPGRVRELRDVDSHAAFVSLVERWRADGMHDDDSTAVIIEWDGSDRFNLDRTDDVAALIAAENELRHE